MYTMYTQRSITQNGLLLCTFSMATREPAQTLLMVNPGIMTEAKACQTRESPNPTTTAALLLLSSSNGFLLALMPGRGGRRGVRRDEGSKEKGRGSGGRRGRKKGERKMKKGKKGGEEEEGEEELEGEGGRRKEKGEEGEWEEGEGEEWVG